MRGRRYSSEVVKRIHDNIIARTGGLPGLLDQGLLEAALAMPYHTFGGRDLYPGVIGKAAILASAIIRSHPFADGNKRTAAILLITFLRRNRLELVASEEEIETVLVSIADHSMNSEQFDDWLRAHVATRRRKHRPTAGA